MITKDDIQTALFKNLFFMPKVWESKKKTDLTGAVKTLQLCPWMAHGCHISPDPHNQ